MRKYIILTLLLIAACPQAHAFWLWTPQESKLFNPKYAVKDTPEEQYNWAMSFYNEKDYKRAAEEFLRLVQYYKNAKLAPDAQYYAAVSYQKAGKYYAAFENFQKAVKNYPLSERIDDITKSEYDIGMYFYTTARAKVMDKEIMTDTERAVEVFTAIVQDTPYSSHADDAQYMIGQAYKKSEQYNEAVTAFQKLVSEYPQSDLVEKSKKEIADCLYLGSQKPDYDQETTDQAIEEYKQYATGITDEKLKQEAEQSIVKLRERKAESSFLAAQFYDKQKKYASAYMYYGEIVKNYPGTATAEKAKNRMDAIKPFIKGEK